MQLNPLVKLKQNQTLIITNKMQMAFRLLQMSNIELSDYVDAEVEKNPVLINMAESDDWKNDDTAIFSENDPLPSAFEIVDLEHNKSSMEFYDAPAYATDTQSSPGERAANAGGNIDWSSAQAGSTYIRRDEQDIFSNLPAPDNLALILKRQLGMLHWEAADQAIAEYLIDLIDEDGYLRHLPGDISETFNVPSSHVTDILNVLKTFEPAGVFACDLGECLALQLQDMGQFDQGMAILLKHLDAVAHHDFNRLMDLSGLSQRKLEKRLALIKSLSPKPGHSFSDFTPHIIKPDILMYAQGHNNWQVELNSDTLPRVLINQRYITEVSANAANNDDVDNFISTCLTDANWLIKAMDQRAQTVLNTAKAIMRRQAEFLEQGLEKLRPLCMQEIADEVGVHKSTISRVVSHKYILTPRGTYELRFFFTTGLPSTVGSVAISDMAVKCKIQRLIACETANTVLSDDNLADILRRDGVDISRRTVTKYRDELGIFSSVERRRRLKNCMAG